MSIYRDFVSSLHYFSGLLKQLSLMANGRSYSFFYFIYLIMCLALFDLLYDMHLPYFDYVLVQSQNSKALIIETRTLNSFAMI